MQLAVAFDEQADLAASIQDGGVVAAVEGHADTDTVDLFTGIITEFEKHAWFLRASLEG